MEGLVEELQALGASVSVAACDVADREQVRALLEGVAPQRPLVGVVHAAGVLDDALVGSLTRERVHGVMAPKVGGAWHLHELTEGLDLRAFVLFSSLSGTLGNAGPGGVRGGERVPRRVGVLPACEGPGGQLAGVGPVGGRGDGRELG